MGANLNTYKFADSIGKEKITERWNYAVEESLYESGHSYSGEIGMLGKGICWLDKNFLLEDDAEEYISENHEKWSKAIAVSFSKDNKKFWLIGGWCSS